MFLLNFPLVKQEIRMKVKYIKPTVKRTDSFLKKKTEIKREFKCRTDICSVHIEINCLSFVKAFRFYKEIYCCHLDKSKRLELHSQN